MCECTTQRADVADKTPNHVVKSSRQPILCVYIEIEVVTIYERQVLYVTIGRRERIDGL